MSFFDDEFLNIAHRGASGHAPENTMVAFQKAIELGADAVECDVQLTRDGIPVILHDYTLERTTNGAGFVLEKSLRKIKKVDAGVWYSSAFKGATIPTLAELLSFMQGKLLVNIELKRTPDPMQLIQRVLHLVEQFNIVQACLITSFDEKALYVVKDMLPACRTGLLAKKLTHLLWSGPWSFVLLRNDIVNVETIERAVEHEKKIIAWTVNAKEDMQRLFDLGVGRIITDYPDIYSSVRKSDVLFGKNNLTQSK
ncbi:glycerophosphodiester phosphodiesterase [candidate division KSB1 bacterium]|nr:glycerophosphodiester phosphodiesterase [candidate division KSB1 bacterium]RQW01075.1 MAG: glycerophosphodiester phosphodiesterase [candidate division KSB1 bacterium]